jgi:large subunit ribosomal protein L1
MAKITKRMKTAQAAVQPGKVYGLEDALNIIKKNATAKFVESVDVAVRLGIDAKKSDQGVRGSSLLPHGTGKTIKVAVFCPAGEKAEAAKAAGADAVGMDDLAERMQGGDLDFGRVIATPDAMRVVGKLGQLLGPRGLMPNPKDGSVTADVVTAVKNAKAGQVKFRNDKAGIIHATIGKANFEAAQLADNLNALIADLLKAKPAAAKGQFLQKVALSSTMGVGVPVDTSSLSATTAK